MNPIIDKLKSEARPFKQIRKFSEKPGIFALFFTGEDFPIPDYIPQKDEIIYLGKTEPGQEGRDERSHFTTGKTGSSTLRRSLGALLKEKLSLKPIPRSDDDFDAGRRSIYKFDDLSEVNLSKWMKENLALSFYESDKSPAETDALETTLIAEAKPLLNIDSKNPGNPHARFIKAARKTCADIANGKEVKIEVVPEPGKTKVVPFRSTAVNPGPNEHKYEEVFKTAFPQIEQAIDVAGMRKLSVQLSPEAFKKAGTRQSYSFNLEFADGVVANDAGGLSVAKDLARVLEQTPGILKKLKGKHWKFNMDKGFVLWVSKTALPVV